MITGKLDKKIKTSKIVKCYLDIGCSYQGDEAICNIYSDIDSWNIKDCGIINILKLEIDKEYKTSREILFKQVLSPMYYKFKCSINDYKKYSLCVLKEFRDADLIVTFNGRDFDIPIIINNLNLSDELKDSYKKYILKKDRDLLDGCILKNLDVKGGLREIVKRLNISVRIEEENKSFLEYFDPYTKKYNNYLITRKKRNEAEIKLLPLLEEKLGYFYEPRSFIDMYHKRWHYNKR